MLFCCWCNHRFYDSELATIEDMNGTERHYHNGCYRQAQAHRQELFIVLDQTPPVWGVSTRRYRDGQVIGS